ncbi:hypothetical protein [Parathalassolituus penaei]|uniref:Uncharacterized protein n=1 Tax=Parathalassolituus penaei TaxID=2997323 RepID=A0A9X3ITT2_9GAMM|nr:hypothetical protein [Parathalassolituus penaei]MCY0965483.1 hypothetical protein [Parathalassolituus penaei]
MKPLCQLLIAIFVSSACYAEPESPTLGRFTEYHIRSTDMIAFSSNGADVRLCSDCNTTALHMSSGYELFDQDTAIDLKTATELYLRRTYPVIFLGIDRQLKAITYIRFGGHSGAY